MKKVLLVLAILLSGIICTTDAFMLTDLRSSNLTGRVIGTNAQSLNGSRSGSIIAGAYMNISAYFSVQGMLVIDETEILIDGKIAKIEHITGSQYKATIETLGDDGIDRHVQVSVPKYMVTGSIPPTTVNSGVYYIKQSNTYTQFATRCFQDDFIITNLSGQTISGTIKIQQKIRVYCHNVIVRYDLEGPRSGTVYQGMQNFAFSNVLGDMFLYRYSNIFKLNTTKIPNGQYVIKAYILSSAGVQLFRTPRYIATFFVVN